MNGSGRRPRVPDSGLIHSLGEMEIAHTLVIAGGLLAGWLLYLAAGVVRIWVQARVPRTNQGTNGKVNQAALEAAKVAKELEALRGEVQAIRVYLENPVNNALVHVERTVKDSGGRVEQLLDIHTVQMDDMGDNNPHKKVYMEVLGVRTDLAGYGKQVLTSLEGIRRTNKGTRMALERLRDHVNDIIERSSRWPLRKE